jgi:hypothetical protein
MKLGKQRDTETYKTKAPPDGAVNDCPTLFSETDDISLTDTVLCGDFTNGTVALCIAVSI